MFAYLIFVMEFEFIFNYLENCINIAIKVVLYTNSITDAH